MIGILPTSLCINGKEYNIRTDFRDILTIFEAFNDVELTEYEKYEVMIEILYKDYQSISDEDMEEAIRQAVWFISCGKDKEESRQEKQVFDWQQDEQMIFSAVNHVAGMETRSMDYLHYWTFIGYFNEIGEGLFSTVISIRQKLNKNKKLEKYEQEFYRANKHLIDIQRKFTKEEQEERERINALLN